MRRVNSAKPIWLKTTATTSAPLQKVRDEDIEASKANPDAPTCSYNAKQRAAVQLAKEIAKSRVQFPGERRRVQSARQQPTQQKQVVAPEAVDTMNEFIN